MRQYPGVAVERTMKVQEVMLRAMSKEITWIQASEILGISTRSMRRWKQHYEEQGYYGLLDRRTGRPSPRRSSMGEVQRILECTPMLTQGTNRDRMPGRSHCVFRILSFCPSPSRPQHMGPLSL